MAGEWQLVKFGDLLISGTRNGIYKGKVFHGSGVKIVNMGELFAHPRLRDVPMKRVELTEAELEKSSLEAGDLLFARRSLVAEGAGKCSIVMEINEPTTFESSIIRARPDSTRADSLFLYYMFNSPQGRYLLGTILRQVAVSGITGTDLIKLRVPKLPIMQQKAIACILGSLDDKIEVNRKMNETLEGMARAIFKYFFVDFGPVKEKIHPHLKSSPKGRGCLPKHVLDLFPDSFQNSELGKIPKGWEMVSLGDLIEFVKGKKPPETANGPGDNLFPVILIDTFDSGASIYANAEGMVHAYSDDVLMVMDGASSGRVETGHEGLVGSTIAKLTPKGSRPGKRFLYYFLKYIESETRDHLTGTSIPHADKGWISQQNIYIPSSARLLEQFEHFSHFVRERITDNLKQSHTLAAIRDSLLPKLLSGEIRVKV